MQALDNNLDAVDSADLFSGAVDTAHEVDVNALVQADNGVSETNTSSPRAPGGMRTEGLKLPLEIIEGIFNAVEEKTDLMACALSCSFFRRKCQSRLFRDLTISCDYGDRAFREGGMVHTIAHGDCHTHIMGLIRWLKIENHYGAWNIPGGGKTVDCLLGKFVRKLKAVEKLEISGIELEWRHRVFADGLVALLQVPTLRELKLRDLEHFPMQLILWGRTLQKVEIEHVLFMQSVFVGFKRPVVSPSLEVFRMDNRELGLTLLGIHFLSNDIGRSMFGCLKELRLEYRDGEGDRPDDINSLLTACQNSLENLGLFFTHEGK